MNLIITPDQVTNCNKCKWVPRTDLKPRWGTTTVLNKQIMIIGESPGCGSKTEDYDEETFQQDYEHAFRSNLVAKFLNKVLLPLHMNIDDVFMTNLVKCAHGDTRPEQRTIDNCKLYTYIQMDMCKPKAIILLGKTPIQHFTPYTSIISNHSTVYTKKYSFICSAHPSYWTRQTFKEQHYLEKMLTESVKKVLEE